jgi:hypothetical protein
MRVAPLGAAGGGSFRLEPAAACAVCGPESCPRFRAAGPADGTP